MADAMLAERALLGCCLLDAGAMADVPHVEPGDFEHPRHAELWRSLRRIAATGGRPDVLTVQADLASQGVEVGKVGGLDYVAELTLDVPSAAAAAAYAQLVVDASTRRHVAALAAELTAAAGDERITPSMLVERCERRLWELRPAQRHAAGKTRHIAEIARETWAQLETLQQTRHGVNGVPSGFSSLDNVTHGFQRGEMTLLGARPSVGKSAWAMNAAANAARAGKHVLFVSVEMADSALAERLLASESQVNSHAFRSGAATPAQWGSVARGVESVGKLPLWVHDGPGITLPALRSLCRRHASKHGLDLVIVDYLQLVRTEGRDLRERATEASSGLKELARELSIPVLALTQLNRESERRDSGKPGLADLRDSGSLEQDADVVLLLWRPGMHKPEVDKSVTELLVVKHRNGPTCKLQLRFVPGMTEFREPVVQGVGAFE